MPAAQRIFCSSNSAAAKKIKKVKNTAAIASKNCSTHYKIPVLKNNIHDIADNTTRFIVIGNHDIDISGVDKTSILVSVQNKQARLRTCLSLYLSIELV